MAHVDFSFLQDAVGPLHHGRGNNRIDTVRVLQCVLPLVMATTSVVACFVFIRKLHKLSRNVRSKLFVRQLWHLAVANAYFALVSATMLVLAITKMYGARAPAGDAFCFVQTGLFDSAHISVMLTEVHIAIVFLAANYKSVASMHVLSNILVLVWPTGLVLGMVCAILASPRWDQDKKYCVGSAADYMFSVILMVCISICCGCYFASAYAVGSSGNAVQQRVWTRAALYVLLAPVVNVPIVLYYLFLRHVSLHQWLFCIARSFLFSGGLLTLTLYAYQSRHLRSNVAPRNSRVTSSHEPELSFRVAFRAEPSIVVFDSARAVFDSLQDYFESAFETPNDPLYATTSSQSSEKTNPDPPAI